jgi:hypothetical protein
VNDGKSWSEMDLFDLRKSLAYGRSIEEVAGFLCRSGTVEEVRRKAEELGLLRRPACRNGRGKSQSGTRRGTRSFAELMVLDR